MTGRVRVAAIDCGTNSIRLLVADVDPATGRVDDLDRQMKIVRLGEGVDRTGRLSPGAIARTLEAVDAYMARIGELGAQGIRMVATSASRDAANADEFVSGVQARLGVMPEVVTGDEEAALSFRGAIADLPAAAAPPWLVVDIGGGSTEFVLGSPASTAGGPRHVRASTSIDVGCVRLSERYLGDDPPTTKQRDAARAAVEAALDQAEVAVPIAGGATMVGLAGTVTTLAAMHLELDSYQPDVIHHSWLPAASVRALSRWLLEATHAERAAVPVMHPGRVDVIGAGALVLDGILQRTGLQGLIVSEHDILDGIALSAAARLAT